MTRNPWSSEEDEQLRKAYPYTATGLIAKRLGRSKASVEGRARALSLRKDRARLIAMGRENVKRRRDRQQESAGDET